MQYMAVFGSLEYKLCTSQLKKLPMVAKSWHLLPNVAICCHMLPLITKSSYLLPKVIICCQGWPFITKISHLLPEIAKKFPFVAKSCH